MTTQITHFIDGKRTAGQSGRTAEVFDPNTGQVQSLVPMGSKSEVDAAVASAARAQQEWAAFNPQRRARVMMRFIELVNEHVDEIAELLSREHGKTLADSRGDIQRGIEVIEFCIGIPHLLKGEYSEGAGSGIDVYSLRQPLGVVAGITPFNFPAMIPLWKAGSALACGNAFVLKPSELTPVTGLKIAEVFDEAGLPKGLLRVVPGPAAEIGATIFADPRVRMVTFTGSTQTGRHLAVEAAKSLKKFTLEMGGKSPLIVLAGLAMTPQLNAGYPWLVWLLDGRQSARTVHFVCAFCLLAFVVLHLLMVLVSGVWNNIRSMITGWYDIGEEHG